MYQSHQNLFYFAPGVTMHYYGSNSVPVQVQRSSYPPASRHYVNSTSQNFVNPAPIEFQNRVQKHRRRRRQRDLNLSRDRNLSRQLSLSNLYHTNDIYRYMKNHLETDETDKFKDKLDELIYEAYSKRQNSRAGKLKDIKYKFMKQENDHESTAESEEDEKKREHATK